MKKNYISKLNIVIGFKSLKGIMFILALKNKITTVKELFMMDMEEGN